MRVVVTAERWSVPRRKGRLTRGWAGAAPCSSTWVGEELRGAWKEVRAPFTHEASMCKADRSRLLVMQSPSPAVCEPPSVRVAEVMRKVRVRNTAPEIAVRRILHSLGVRFRVRPTRLPGCPDITNCRRSWCIFVHGCFWHGHSCRRGRLPKKNAQFWRAKIRANRERDIRVENELRALGFRVLTVWQCELRNAVSLTSKLRSFIEVGTAP